MNRKIKFRAKELSSNNWVYGYYAMRSEESPVPETNEWYCEHYILIDKGIQGFEEVEIDIKTLSQFTGILDKSNAEIYEGDFVSTDLQRPHNKVIYKNGAFMFECYDDNLYHDIFYSTSELEQSNYKYGKVIGNIIDNPELDYLPS
jgi:uncharacterized phage protein (TIGR01671 family)